MESILHGSSPEYRRGDREERIDAADPGGLGTQDARVEMHDLDPRVHTAVRTARAHDRNLATGDRGQRVFERVLDASASALSLPAQEARAVVLQT